MLAAFRMVLCELLSWVLEEGGDELEVGDRVCLIDIAWVGQGYRWIQRCEVRFCSAQSSLLGRSKCLSWEVETPQDEQLGQSSDQAGSGGQSRRSVSEMKVDGELLHSSGRLTTHKLSIHLGYRLAEANALT